MERLKHLENSLGTSFKISDLLNFTSSFWYKIRYQNEVDKMGEINQKRNSAKNE